MHTYAQLALMIGLPLGAGLALAPFAGRGAIVFALCSLLFVGATPCRGWAFYLPDVACAMITVSPRAAALRRTLHFPIVDG